MSSVDMKNPFTFPNVFVEDNPNLKARNITKDTAKVANHRLAEVVATLAFERPLWNIFISGLDYEGKINKFRITQEGEKLGEISVSYYRRDYAVAISNDRIAESRQRGGPYRTQDVAKAVATAKKMFKRRSIGEVLEAGKMAATSVLNKLAFDKERVANKAAMTYDTALLDFMKRTPELVVMFAKHLRATNREHIDTQASESRFEMLSIREIRDKFAGNETFLVLKVDDKYVVHKDDKVDIFDDNTFPENLRGKLGLLKLVEDDHCVTDVGCRITSEIFVVLPDEEQPQPQQE